MSSPLVGLRFVILMPALRSDLVGVLVAVPSLAFFIPAILLADDLFAAVE